MKKVVSAILAALLLTGCGGPAAVSQPDRSQVVISISEEPESLDPCRIWGHGATPLVQSALVEYNPDMSFSKDLAEDYTLSGDGRIWTFSLRRDVKFTDGEPLTAEDVVFTFETAMASQTAIDLTFLDRVEARDDYTVVFTLKNPTSTFLNTLALVGIVPKHAYSEHYGDAPIGSGPFRFVEWNKQEQLILEANPGYYGKVPAIRRIVIVFQDEDAAFAAVRAGQVDVALTAATMAGTEVPGYRLERVTTVDNRGFTLPLTPARGKTTPNGHPMGNDVTCRPEIRKSMAYWVDREQIALQALGGFATPCYSMNDGLPWSNPQSRIETDRDYARKLLADAGWQDTDGDGIVELDGLKASFTCLYPSGDSVRQAVSLAAAQQMKELGIEITVEGTSWDDITNRMFENAVCMGGGSYSPYESFLLFHSSCMLRDDFYNPEGFADPTVDGYLESALAATDPEEANRFWQLSQWDGTTGTSMKGTCPWVWLVNLEHLYYVREGLDIGVQPLHPHGSSMPLLQNLKTWTWEP